MRWVWVGIAVIMGATVFFVSNEAETQAYIACGCAMIMSGLEEIKEMLKPKKETFKEIYERTRMK